MDICAAYFADNGKIAWDVDTKGDYQTVNGVSSGGRLHRRRRNGQAWTAWSMSDPGLAMLGPSSATSCSHTPSTDCDASACRCFSLSLGGPEIAGNIKSQ